MGNPTSGGQGWSTRRRRGVRRGGAIWVLPEFTDAVREIAKTLGLSNGEVTERALLAYMESLPNGTGERALELVAEVRHHAEQDEVPD